MSDDPSSYGYGSEFASWSSWGKGLHIMTYWSHDQPTYSEITNAYLPQCNYNRVGNRESDNLDGTGLLSPFVDGGGVLHIDDAYPTSFPVFWHFHDTGTPIITCDNGVYACAGYTSEPQTVTEDERNTAWRDTGQCSWINTSGTPVSSATRIPHDEIGCHDSIPGVFGIRFVAGSINPGVSAKINLVHGESWYRAWNKDAYPPSIEGNKSSAFCYYDLDHPYINPDEEITVSLASGNENKHIIPGVSITFNANPDPGSTATVAIGWEYVDSFVGVNYDDDEWGEWFYTGTEVGGPAFVPLSSFAPVQQGVLKAFQLSHGKGPSPHFVAMNNSGELLTGCKIKLMVFCRLDQGRAITPFDSWFQGGGAECLLSSGEYTVTFQNVRTGSPTAVDLYCSGSVDTDIWAVNESDYSLGQQYYDGEGLLADASTLYHWPAFGVYFRLSTDIENYDTATVTVYNDKLEFASSSDFSAKDIGRWGKTIGNVTANGFYQTGQLQTQGYEVEFFDEDLEPIRTKWYNHFDAVSYATTSTLSTPLEENRRYYTGLQLYCDDPKFFCFVPLTFFSHGANSISKPQPTYKALCGDSIEIGAGLVARTGEPDKSLIFRVQTLPSGMKAVLDDIGVTKS